MITWLEKKVDKFLVQCKKWAIQVKQVVADVNVPQEYESANIKPRPTGNVAFVPTATGSEYNATYVPSSSAMTISPIKVGEYVCPMCRGIYHSSDMKMHYMLTRKMLLCISCDNLLNTIKAEKTVAQIQSRRI